MLKVKLKKYLDQYQPNENVLDPQDWINMEPR